MNRRTWSHRFLAAALALVSLTAPAAFAASDPRPETAAASIEALLDEVLQGNAVEPEFTDHGGGLQSLGFRLDAEQRDRLATALGSTDKAAVEYYFLAAGQQLTPPANPSTLIHAALSNTRASYNYWVVVVNLGDAITRNTTFRLTGPGRTFNRTFPLLYRANSIWIYWTKAPSVNAPGFYHYFGTVSGAGTFTIHTAAVNP